MIGILLMVISAAEEEATEFETVLGTTTPSFLYDFTWTKDRNNATSHVLSNTIAGDFYQKSDLPSAEIATIPTVDSDDITFGFNLPTDDASNTDGSITTITKKNSFMSEVSYVGNATDNATVGHSLGIIPELIISKNRDTINVWAVSTTEGGLSLGVDYLELNDTLAKTAKTNLIKSASSSLLTLGSGANANGSGNEIMNYCFTSVVGKCKVGTVTISGGTMSGDTDLGFPLGFGIFKRTDSTGDWEMINSETTNFLEPNTANTEATNGADRVTVVGDVISNNGLPDGTYVFLAIK